MNRPVLIVTACMVLAGITACLSADDPQSSGRDSIQLDKTTRQRCVTILREGMRGDEFWPSIHAAEGLTLGGHGAEVIAFLKDKLPGENDDQQRCGIAREMVRAGDKSKTEVMLDILASQTRMGTFTLRKACIKSLKSVMATLCERHSTLQIISA